MGNNTGRTLWLDPTFGASGDMLLGALTAIGGSISQVRTQLTGLPLADWVDSWTLNEKIVDRNSISATKVTVTTSEDATHRPWSKIDAALSNSDLPEVAITNSRETFRRLAEAEAAVHHVPVDDVHFHEVGAADAIIDIVGVWLLLEQLNVEAVVVGPIGVSFGTIQAAHGTLPSPAPATATLLTGMPLHPLDNNTESVTPTGAALLSTMATVRGPIPAGTLQVMGRGAGGRNPEGYPNVVSAGIVNTNQVPVMLATNLDDVTAEVVGHLINRLLEAGADDAWVTPIGMKKNRPGYELKALTSQANRAVVEHIICAETQTLGVRSWPVTKTVLPRKVEHVMVRGQSVAVKVGPHGAKPEHDDLVTLSKSSGVSIQKLHFEALSLFSDTQTGSNQAPRSEGNQA